jgi:hypothetical protein
VVELAEGLLGDDVHDRSRDRPRGDVAVQGAHVGPQDGEAGARHVRAEVGGQQARGPEPVDGFVDGLVARGRHGRAAGQLPQEIGEKVPAPRLGNAHRRRGVDHDHRHRPTAPRPELAGDLVGDHSTHRPAQQAHRPVAERRGDGVAVAAGEVLQAVERRGVAVETGGFEAVDGLVVAEQAGEGGVHEHRSGDGVHAHQRRAGAPRLQRHERRGSGGGAPTFAQRPQQGLA